MNPEPDNWMNNIIIPENINIEFDLDELDNENSKREKIIDTFISIVENKCNKKLIRWRLIKTIENKVFLVGNRRCKNFWYSHYVINKIRTEINPDVWNDTYPFTVDYKYLNNKTYTQHKFKFYDTGIYLFTDN
jgi:hypothetical protein